MDRRSLLKTAGLAAAGLSLDACGARRRVARIPPPPGDAASAALPPVHVSWDRIIRTVAGLRPFRLSGFRLEAEQIDEKALVHNYGHGGGGVTLSWGTSQMAVEKALATHHRRFAVVGCGAVGLAAALLLQRRGMEVTLYARDIPPHTTSNVAGASFYPSFVVDPERRTPEFEALLLTAARISYRHFQEMVGVTYGVRWVEEYHLSDNPPQENWLDVLLKEFHPRSAVLEPGDHPFGVGHVHRKATLMIEPPVYMNALMRDFRTAGGRIVVREFSDLDDLFTLEEPVILNCAGLGAGSLVGDSEMMPVKGQLTFLLPQPEVNYILSESSRRSLLYMMPRTDGILLGGTAERGVWDLEPSDTETKRIVEGHMRIFGRMDVRAPRSALRQVAEVLTCSRPRG